jgi:membrane-bound lytic murein transglycosylase B
MKETRLGQIEPSHDAFIVFNTLLTELDAASNRDKRLLKMAEKNMVSIMRYCYKNDIHPDECRFNSSYAGAVGIPQFMPQNFGHIEGYKRKVGDLTRMEDAIVSASRFLHYNAKIKESIVWEKVPPMDKIEAAWYEYDHETENASFVFEKSRKSGASLNCFTCGDDSLTYVRDIAKSLMRYNYSSNYAVGVLRLAYEANRLGSRAD